MPPLRIILEEGFTADHVRIDVANREIFNRDQVRTRNQAGFADFVDLDVEAGRPVVVTVVVESRARADISLVPANATYLLLSLGPDGLVHRVTDQPPKYA